MAELIALLRGTQLRSTAAANRAAYDDRLRQLEERLQSLKDQNLSRPPLRSPDGPIATSGPKKRSLDAVCWTSVGHVMPTRAPGGPAFRQWSRLVPCVRHLRGRTAEWPSRHPAIARCRKPTRIKRL